MHRLHIITRMALIAVLGISCLKSFGQATNQQAQGAVKQLWYPSIRVQFLGLTNDASGAKLAKFALHNIGKEPLVVSIPGFVDQGMRGGGYVEFTNDTTLQSGASVETSIYAPAREIWRAEFLCGSTNVYTFHGTNHYSFSESIYSGYFPTNKIE